MIRLINLVGQPANPQVFSGQRKFYFLKKNIYIDTFIHTPFRWLL